MTRKGPFVGVVIIAISLSASAREALQQNLEAEPGMVDIVMRQGIVNLGLWLLLVGVLTVMPILSVTAVAQAFLRKRDGMPLASKLLPCLSGFAVLIGILGLPISALKGFAGAANAGSELDRVLALAISNAIWVGMFSTLMAMVGVAAFIICLIITHLRMRKSAQKADQFSQA